MYGLGTIINVVAILVGATIGVLVGHRLPERTRTTVTDALGLVTLVIGGLNVVALRDQAFVDAVGGSATLLIVLGALLIGGILGSLLQLEKRLEDVGGWLQARFSSGDSGRARFVEGFVDSSLIFCIGPLAVLGALSDGLGQGIDELALKATLDGFASIAFAASLGWGGGSLRAVGGRLAGTVDGHRGAGRRRDVGGDVGCPHRDRRSPSARSRDATAQSQVGAGG